VRGWLLDNNVPRGVAHVLADHGEDAVEVRSALGQDAPDDVVVAYAVATKRWLVTHDRGCARSALVRGVAHVWLRTREPIDADRVRDELAGMIAALSRGAIRVTVLNVGIRTTQSDAATGETR